MRRYVNASSYKAGLDDKVDKWVGPHFENDRGLEAELDIQYLMGVAPGVGPPIFRREGGHSLVILEGNEGIPL